MKTKPLPQYLALLFPILVFVTVAFVRIRLLSVPLERDEGEYAYMGQLLLKGIAPFTHAYSMKLPGVSFIYAFFMFLFGQTPFAIHLGLLIVNALCVYLVYLITKRLVDRDSAALAAASYAVLSLSSSVNGLFAHATHFVVLFALTGFLLLLNFIDNRRTALLFLSGVSFGLAVIMKQHGFLLFLFAACCLGRDAWHNRPMGKKTFLAGFLFLLGSAIPYALIVLLMVATGRFSDFWFWTMKYAREYAATPTLAEGWFSFSFHFKDICFSQLPLWLLAGAGCVLLGTSKKSFPTDRSFCFGLLCFSVLAICPGFYFSGHYFILLLPALALMIGAGIGSSRHLPASNHGNKSYASLAALLVVAAIGFSFYQERRIYFSYSPGLVSRTVYGLNPFPEALQIAQYLKANTSPGDKIIVLGSEPEIYFYSDRLSASGYIYMYGLMEKQPYAERMQTQMIQEIESARPKYIVNVHVDMSWLTQDSSIKTLLKWGAPYVRDFYDQVGLIDIVDPNTTHYYWDASALTHNPVSESYVVVYKRRSGM
jgi:4-amino-4-deoxy-L-arabinose transferase-like glycosyltransferase